mmetsp:Transcript_43701/g.111712  ORF Transcript_43701/g.111712 Transcript_43701/m.111712 type:complete len:319 (-) Transcript_43701:44-1000(-)
MGRSTFAAGANTVADDSQDAPQREKKEPARQRASTLATAPECHISGKPLCNQNAASPSRFSPTAHSQSSPATDVSACDHEAHTSSSRSCPGSSTEGSSRASQRTQLMRKATGHQGGSGVELMRHPQPRKVRGAPAHGASLGNEADFLRQPAKPHASASLGSRVEFLRSASKGSRVSDRKQSPSTIRVIAPASDTLPQLPGSPRLKPQPPGHSKSSSHSGLWHLNNGTRAKTSDGVMQLPSPTSPLSSSRSAAALSGSEGSKAKRIGKGAAAASPKGQPHRGRAQQALPAIGGIDGSALAMGARRNRHPFIMIKSPSLH